MSFPWHPASCNSDELEHAEPIVGNVNEFWCACSVGAEAPLRNEVTAPSGNEIDLEALLVTADRRGLSDRVLFLGEYDFALSRGLAESVLASWVWQIQYPLSEFGDPDVARGVTSWRYDPVEPVRRTFGRWQTVLSYRDTWLHYRRRHNLAGNSDAEISVRAAVQWHTGHRLRTP